MSAECKHAIITDLGKRSFHSVTKRLACVTLDVEPDEPGDARIRLFDDRKKFSWFRDVLRDMGAPLTAFIMMRHADCYASALAELAATLPVEMAIHSYSHDRRRTASHDEVRRARDAFVMQWGGAPEGYRAPYGLIDSEGLRTLMNEGFYYDSSIFPTLRLDEFGYNHLRYPRTPFVFTDGDRELVEVPLAALRGCRLVYSLSFVKLFGPYTFRSLMQVFPLPDVVVVDLHPYDFYVGEVAHAFRSWKRFAHLRNSNRAKTIFEQMLTTLQNHGYDFTTVGAVARLASASATTRIPVPPS